MGGRLLHAREAPLGIKGAGGERKGKNVESREARDRHRMSNVEGNANTNTNSLSHVLRFQRFHKLPDLLQHQYQV